MYTLTRANIPPNHLYLLNNDDRVTGSLTSVTMAATFELEMDTATLSCIVGKTRDFPNLKMNTNQKLFLRLLTNYARGKTARLTDSFKQ